MKTPRALLLAISFLLPLVATAASIFELMYSESHVPRAVRLEVPMDSLFNKTEVEQASVLSFTDVYGKPQEWTLKVGVRGNFRRENCDHAPLKLNFDRSDLKDAGLEKYDKYKLVTGCFDTEEAINLVYREYLAYRAYNLISEQSFKVQLLAITMVDHHGKHPDWVTAGFIIEGDDELAHRLGVDEFSGASGAPAFSYDGRAEATHALFQYLLGNGDYNTSKVHNLKVFGTPQTGLIPVGYDFDFSGWVDAPYAQVTYTDGPPLLDPSVYLGYAHNDVLLRSVADHFLARETAVLSLINAFTLLPKKEQRNLRSFAKRFFKALKRMNEKTERLLYDQLREVH